MKISSSDLLAIARRFGVADENNVPRHIEQVKTTNPSSTNQVVSFRFDRNFYYVLIDDAARDNEIYINQELLKVNSNLTGELLENPTSLITTFGLPFKGKDIYLFKAISGKKRLDVLLAEYHPETSRSTWQKHIKAGHILVNGGQAKNAKQDVTDADSITINIPEGTDFSAYEFPILFIDDDVIVVNKPAGVLTHAKGALNDEFTIAEFFRRYTTVGLDTNRPGIVHRLDRDTSGVIVGARTQEAFERLKSQFADRKAGKYYVAIVDGIPKQAVAKIDIPIARNPSAPSTFRADSKGKAAVTNYEVLAQSTVSNLRTSLLALHPLTGRTHQLRVHLQYLGTPIVGDRVYGGSKSDRLYLHAHKLKISTGHDKLTTFTAPIPACFRDQYPEIDNGTVNG